MDELKFQCHFGDELVNVEIVSMAGHCGSDDVYQLYLNNYYRGVLVKRRGVWTSLMQNEDLETADIEILGDLIESHFGGFGS